MSLATNYSVKYAICERISRALRAPNERAVLVRSFRILSELLEKFAALRVRIVACSCDGE
jgi:hypothetical protein